MKFPATIDLLLKRRSAPAHLLDSPGPTPDELETILRCATRVPDHKMLQPWRIQIVDRTNQDKLFAKLPELHTGDPEQLAKTLRKQPRAAPLLLIVSSRSASTNAPRSEQLLSGGALCQNVLVAAHALGYRGQWTTDWMAYSDNVKALLGIPTDEEILGFIYLGSIAEPPPERPRPDLPQIVSRLEL